MGYEPRHRIAQAVRGLSWRARAAVIGGTVILAGAGATAALAASAGNVPVSNGQLQGTVYVCVQLNNESHQFVELHSQVAGNCPSGYVQYHVNQSAPLGLTAPPSATASTSVSNRPDSGDHGTWAYDDFTRTASVNRVGQVSSSNCAGHSPCYLYSGQVNDTGAFYTIAGAPQPNGTGTLPGTPVQGSFSGSGSYEFYSTSAAPDATPPATENDNKSTTDPAFVSTGSWVKQFFKVTDSLWSDGGTLGSVSLLNTWSWTYTYAPCAQDSQTWVDAAAGQTGNITGLNNC